MEVILRHAVSKIGKIGDKVKVKAGFARNFLVPKGLAYPATPENWNRIQKEKKVLALKELKEKWTRIPPDIPTRFRPKSHSFWI